MMRMRERVAEKHPHHLQMPPLQTTTFMSSIQPSSTATASATALHKTALSPSSSPPFVLSFLSISLFSVAMIFIFWRRIHLNRRWRMTVLDLNINRSHLELPIINEDVPKLWNLRNGRNFVLGREKGGIGVGSQSDVRWINLMPLSLSTQTKEVLSVDPQSITDHRIPITDRRIPNLTRLPWWKRNRSSSRHDDGVKTSTSTDNGMKVTMQVAITIALPSAQSPIHIKNRNIDKDHEVVGKDMDEDMDGQNMTDYCIGMYECPWRK